MTNPNMNAGFAGQMLDVSGAVAKMKKDIASLNNYSKIADDNQYLLNKLTTNLDAKTPILQAEISVSFSGVGLVTVQLSPVEDKLVVEKIISMLAEALAIRTADALEKVRETAAQLSA